MAIKAANWDPQISQDGHEMTIHGLLAGSYMDPRVVDVTEELGKLMDVKCAQPNNTNIVRNPKGKSWLGPSWLWVVHADDLILERAWGMAETPASLPERDFTCIAFSPSYSLAWFLPFLLTVGQETGDTKSTFTSWMFRWRIIPVGIKKARRDKKNEGRVKRKKCQPLSNRNLIRKNETTQRENEIMGQADNKQSQVQKY